LRDAVCAKTNIDQLWRIRSGTFAFALFQRLLEPLAFLQVGAGFRRLTGEFEARFGKNCK